MSNEAELTSVSEEQYNPSEAITIVDLAEAHGVTRLTAKKRLDAAELQPVAKLSRGRAGRPPVLFARAAADAAMTVKSRGGDVVAQAAADALAE